METAMRSWDVLYSVIAEWTQQHPVRVVALVFVATILGAAIDVVVVVGLK